MDPTLSKFASSGQAYGNSKQQLYERAKELGVRGRSSMSKEELAETVARKQ